MEAGKVKKVLFVLLVTMLIGGVCETAEAKEIYAGGSAPNFVYHYIDGNSWSTISPNFNGAVLCICEYDGNLYAGTGVYSAPREGFGSLSGDDTKSPVSKEKLILSGEVINTDSAVGQVWRHDGSSNWTQVGDNLDGQVCSLSVYRGLLYAGTAVGSGKLYRYDGGTTWTNVVDFIDADPNDPINRTWSGFRSMYAWNDLLYTGDIYYDLIGYYDGNDFTQVADLGGSCIWDFEEYNNYLYASAFEGRVHRSSDGNTWTTILDDPNEIDQAWELEAFQGHLYVATGSKLKRCDECDGNDFSLVWTEPNGYEIISMISMGDALIFGTGEEAGSGRGEGPGIGKIYRTDDGNNPQPISGNTGGGIQSLYAEAELILTKDDDIENCVWRNGDINYRIDYSYLCGTTFPDIDDVNIVDELPEEVDFISASDDGNHDSNTHTVTWNIGTLSPGESGFVTLKVKVKTGVECGGTITNPCNIKSGDDYWISADVNTAVCDPNKTIWLDFDSPDANGEPNTQPGFMSFLYPDDDGSDVCGITIDILPDIPDLSPSAQIMIRTKLNDKSDDWRENGIGVELYPDLIYAKHPSGINITLWELGAGQTCTITLWAYDNQSENVREAYWNVNGVFAFRAAFIGGTAWPWCMENPCDYNSYAYDVTVTADDLGRVKMTSVMGPNSLSQMPFAFACGLRVIPGAYTSATTYAHRPLPLEGQINVPVRTVLQWRNGAGTTRDVYLSTDFNDVNNGVIGAKIAAAIAANSVDPYGATGFLKVDTTYYWRVDEVNGVTPQKGEVWSFTTAPYCVVDDWDSYADTDALRFKWKDYWTQDYPYTSAECYHEPAIVRSGNSMRYDFKNFAYPPYYSEVRANTADLAMDPNWTGMGAVALSLWFRGVESNPTTEPMYVKLTDGDSNFAMVVYGSRASEDPNYVKDENDWHEWNIPLTAFTGVNMRNVAQIVIRFGEPNGPAGNNGTVYFDDLVLYPTRCVHAERTTDFAKIDYAPVSTPAGDCVINLREFGMMANNWLMASPPADPNVDLHSDGMIDFKDFAILADMWLEEEMFP